MIPCFGTKTAYKYLVANEKDVELAWLRYWDPIMGGIWINVGDPCHPCNFRVHDYLKSERAGSAWQSCSCHIRPKIVFLCHSIRSDSRPLIAVLFMMTVSATVRLVIASSTKTVAALSVTTVGCCEGQHRNNGVGMRYQGHRCQLVNHANPRIWSFITVNIWPRPGHARHTSEV